MASQTEPEAVQPYVVGGTTRYRSRKGDLSLRLQARTAWSAPACHVSFACTGHRLSSVGLTDVVYVLFFQVKMKSEDNLVSRTPAELIRCQLEVQLSEAVDKTPTAPCQNPQKHGQNVSLEQTQTELPFCPFPIHLVMFPIQLAIF